MITKMKFKQLFFAFMLMAFMGVTVSGSAWAETKTLELRPDGATGKDARVHSIFPDTNTGTDACLRAQAWTWQGRPGALRSFIQFDLTSIPSDAAVTSAKMSLYADTCDGITTLTASNASALRRVTSAWDENTVTWNNQPSTTTQNQVLLSEIPHPVNPNESKLHQDYPGEIDVTNLVIDMVANPAANFGFMFGLQKEQFYSLMSFSSSDATDPNLRPKLVVTYENKNTNPDNNGILIDMDISTINYEDINDVESELSVHENDEIWVCVVARGVTDLDTYQVEVFFDTGKLQFLEGAEENPIGGIKNLLKKNGGTTTGFLAVEKTPGTVNISNTLTGADCNQAPEGSGAIALLKFKVLSAGPNSELTPDNAFFVDCTGNNKEITELRNGTFIGPDSIPGDFNTDGKVDFLDLGLLANYWLLKKTDSGWNAKYDLEEDGIINYLDLSVLGDHWLEEN